VIKPLYDSHVDVTFEPAELALYSGPNVNQKFAGEDDLVWCERCKIDHRRGAGWEIEQQRMIEKMARQIAEKIDGDTANAIR
jgi:hypothetical protein